MHMILQTDGKFSVRTSASHPLERTWTDIEPQEYSVLDRDLTFQDSDTESLEVHSTRSQAPDDSEREVLPPAELEPDPSLMRPSAAAMRAGLPLLDGKDLSQVFSHRAAVMKAVPKISCGVHSASR